MGIFLFPEIRWPQSAIRRPLAAENGFIPKTAKGKRVLIPYPLPLIPNFER